MTRRMQNRQESIDSQEGAGQPVEFQAVSVEYRRQRIARRPVGTRAKRFPRHLRGKLRQSKASAEVWEPSPHTVRWKGSKASLQVRYAT